MQSIAFTLGTDWQCECKVVMRGRLDTLRRLLLDRRRHLRVG